MGYIQFLEMDNNGVEWKDLSELSFGDSVELELAVTQNAVQLACVICFKPIASGTGFNTCDTHRGQKPKW